MVDEANEYETVDFAVRILPYCKPLKACEEILYRLSHQIVDYLLEKGVPANAASEHHLTL